jgi:hypothetical protein
MTPIELLKRELDQAEQHRDQASHAESHAATQHLKAQKSFSDAVDRVKALKDAIEVLEAAQNGL